MLSAAPPTRHALGQYFTTDLGLQRAVCAFVRNRPTRILEPSAGRGDLVAALRALAPDAAFDMYELDERIQMLPGVARADMRFGDFMTQSIETRYATIVGNPPYVRTKTGNLYVEFTERCFGLLAPGGELVFVVPSDFFKLTCAARLLAEMMRAGTFTDLHRPHKENLFAGASVDVLVFRYCLDPALPKLALCDGAALHVSESGGVVAFGALAPGASRALREAFDVLVGFVSGNEGALKSAALGNLAVRNGEGAAERYIVLDAFPTEDPALNAHMLGHKAALLARGVRKFGEADWFRFGLPRNAGRVAARAGDPCIYVYSLTRRARVAFVGAVEPFGGGLLMLLPKAVGGAGVDLDALVGYMNGPEFRGQHSYSGRFKVGQRVLAEARVPRSLMF